MRVRDRTIAAPSWVIPGTAAENCRFLSGRVDEVGLLFLESEACLDYGPKDLPPDLAALPLSWHVHLPLDLPWHNPAEAGRTATALMDKAAFLGARRAVLHPPCPGANEALNVKKLTAFIEIWADSGRSPADLLLENTPQTGPDAILNLALRFSTMICFDLGHFFLHNDIVKVDSAVPPPGLVSRLGMLHLNAPWPGDRAAVAAGGRESGRHAPLGILNAYESSLAAELCRQAPHDCVLMLELFGWKDVESSRRILEGWLNQ